MGILDNLKSLFDRGARVDIVARFEREREAISGTMSSFFVARDRQTRKLVGLKILDSAKMAAAEARFKGLNKPTEGEITSQLDHPNIVKVFEHGVTTTGEQFLVMELLDGPGLNSLIVARSPQLDGHRVSLIRQAAAALGAVHKAGFIHRDICPRNFVVTKDCTSLKLIDFGLTVPAQPPFMQPGNRTGTVNYMAPEVVRRQATTHRLDIFAFGVTAYELCTFELPWPRGSTGQDAMKHGLHPPTDIRQHRPHIDPRLAEAITACLHAEPDRRPASMDHFVKMIERVEREDVKA